MSIILDTSALFYPRALAELEPLPERVVVPTVAFAERARHLHRDSGMHPQEFLAGMRRHRFHVEPLGPEEAMQFAPFLADRDWRRLSADALIAGHVHDGDQLWTANVADFLEVGLRKEQVVDVRAF